MIKRDHGTGVRVADHTGTAFPNSIDGFAPFKILPFIDNWGRDGDGWGESLKTRRYSDQEGLSEKQEALHVPAFGIILAPPMVTDGVME